MYVEVFGGGAAVLFAKPPGAIDVYNDIDNGLVNFFRVLRDRTEELREKLALTPYARNEFLHCRKTWPDEKDELEKARKWFVCTTLSFDSAGRSTGWKTARYTNSNKAAEWSERVDELTRFARRMRGVQVDCRRWQKCVDTYDREDVVFYLDPPYLHSTRSGGVETSNKEYRYEMSAFGHEQFLKHVLTIKGSVIISGYDSAIYRRKLEQEGGFERYEYDMANLSDNVSEGGERGRRLEIIWRKTNYKDLRLFDVVDKTIQEPTPAA
jgi:DNA adenine methylase